MTHRTHENSIDAYNEIKADLPKAKLRVLNIIEGFNLFGSAPTDKEILKECRKENPHMEIGGVTGRVKELIDAGAVREHGKIKDKNTKKTCRILWITGDIMKGKQETLFQEKSCHEKH